MVREFERQGNGWFWQTDRSGELVYLSSKVEEAVLMTGNSATGVAITDIFHSDSDQADAKRTFAFHLSSRTGFSDLSVQSTRNGEERWWSISGRPLTDDFGNFQGFTGSGSDLTEKRRADAEITRLATFDPLTGLANRQRMKIALDQMLAQSAIGLRPTALFLLDLDRFKAVNDTLGHQTGDELLKQVAMRLQRCVQEDGMAGRIGGDEFQVLLPNEDNRHKLSALADTIIATLSQPYFIKGSSVSIGCSIGIASAPDQGATSDTLVRNADLALYASKAAGRGVHSFFHHEMLTEARNRKRMEEDLRSALQLGQLSVAYQPVVSMTTSAISGFEALLRWNHPVHGPISPADFVPIAEECGLIEALGEWVLQTATREAALWPGNVRIAVNVSPIQFANPQLPTIVMNALAASGIAPERLELEVTESVFVSGTTNSGEMFDRLKRLGLRLALDDFGTGYSSLGYLQRIPFDKIKIDQSFVRGAAIPGNRNAAIIQAIVTLANELGMETTAEGVEVQDEIELIRRLGCSHIQGYVYGKAMGVEAVRALLEGSGLSVAPKGVRVSRNPRLKMLRNVRFEVGGRSQTARLRDISTTGAMVDGVNLPISAVGTHVAIELIDQQMVGGSIRWISEGRIGVAFDYAFDLDRLNGSNTTAFRPGIARAR